MINLTKNKKIEILLITTLITLLLVVSPNYNNFKVSEEIKQNPSIDPRVSESESGGGYLMNTGATYSWEEISGTGTNMTSISETYNYYQEISFTTPGWNFTFYETEYDTIYVSSNGWMSFTDTSPDDSYSSGIPSINSINNDMVALFFENLDTRESIGGGDIYYEFKTDPNRLIIQYNNVHYSWGDGLLGTFELILYASGMIIFQYQYLDIQWLGYDIGLDHGDLINYNSFDDWDIDDSPISNEAIEFTFDTMKEIRYQLQFDILDLFEWNIAEVNHFLMDANFGSSWESDFGLLTDMAKGEKIGISIISIIDNATHWNINYNRWDWIDRKNQFSITPEDSDSILYRQEPQNYSSPHMLDNTYPFFLPNNTFIYLNHANLDSYYDDIDLYMDEVKLEHNDYSVDEYIYVDATYDLNGILTELEIIYEYDDDEIYYDEIIFKMVLLNKFDFPEEDPSFIPGANLFVILIILLGGITSLVFHYRRNIK